MFPKTKGYGRGSAVDDLPKIPQGGAEGVVNAKVLGSILRTTGKKKTRKKKEKQDHFWMGYTSARIFLSKHPSWDRSDTHKAFLFLCVFSDFRRVFCQRPAGLDDLERLLACLPPVCGPCLAGGYRWQNRNC